MASPPPAPVLAQLHRLLTGGAAAPSDPQLLEVFLARRDEDAFATLVHRHGPMVRAVCRRLLPCPHDAEDAFQATFLVLVRKARSLGRPERLGNWLYGVAYRTALKARGRRARHRTCELPPDIPVEGGVAEIVWRELRPLLDGEIDRLPEKLRIPVVMCCLEGLSKGAAARHLGWPEGTLSTRLHQARLLLRRRLAGRGLTLSAVALAAALPEGVAPAAVPAALATTTVTAAAQFAAGSAAVPAGALILMEGVVRAMLMKQIKVVTALVLAAGLFVAGVGSVATRVPAAASPSPPAEQQPGGAVVVPVVPAQDPNPDPGQEKPRKLPLDPEVTKVVWSPDGQRFASFAERTVLRKDRVAFDHLTTVKIWDARTGKVIVALGDLKGGAVHDLAFTPDGRDLALSFGNPNPPGNGRIELWDVAAAKLKRTVEIHDGAFGSRFAIAPDGKSVAVVRSAAEVVDPRLVGGTLLIDLDSGKVLRELRGHKDLVISLAFSPDARRLATRGGLRDQTLCVWDLSSGKLLWTAQLGGAVAGVAFSPDGKLVGAAQGQGRVALLDGATGKTVRTLPDAGDQNYRVAFSPDGRLLLGSGQGKQGEVRLLELATGKLVRKWEDTRGSAAFVPDGSAVAVLDRKGVLWLWPLDQAAVKVAQKPAPAQDHFKKLVDELLVGKKTDGQVVEALFLATVGRFPTEAEQKVALAHLAKHQDRRNAVEDLLFALTHSREFFARLDALNQADPRKQK